MLCLGISEKVLIPHLTTFSIVFSCFLVISLDVLSLALFMGRASSISNLSFVQFSLVPLTDHFMFSKFVSQWPLVYASPL